MRDFHRLHGVDVRVARIFKSCGPRMAEHDGRVDAVPELFARFAATVHVPHRRYVETLPGVPTIRMFEAFACGIPLVSAPWDDWEGLFRPGLDYRVATTGAEVEAALAVSWPTRRAAHHCVRASARQRTGSRDGASMSTAPHLRSFDEPAAPHRHPGPVH